MLQNAESGKFRNLVYTVAYAVAKTAKYTHIKRKLCDAQSKCNVE